MLPCEVTPTCLALLLALSPTSSNPLLVIHSVTFHLIIIIMVMIMMMKMMIMTRSGWRTRMVEAPQGRERRDWAGKAGEARWQVNSTCNSFTGQHHL